MNAVRVMRIACALALLAPALPLDARPAHKPSDAPVKLAPGEVLARYSAALRALPTPPAQSFDYAVEQLGLRDMEQTHHVYLSGRRERDETTVVDGYALKRPWVRVIANRTNRYDIAAVAPKTAAYAFVYRGAVLSGTHYLYAFKTVPLEGGSFAVSEIQIDGRRFLPARIFFSLLGGNARGRGVLAYGASERYWMVREAQVDAHLADGTAAHEHIAWSGYSFPSALPPSTFNGPSHAVEQAAEPVAAAPENGGP